MLGIWLGGLAMWGMAVQLWAATSVTTGRPYAGGV
jgi:hypothetical protein